MAGGAQAPSKYQPPSVVDITTPPRSAARSRQGGIEPLLVENDRPTSFPGPVSRYSIRQSIEEAEIMAALDRMSQPSMEEPQPVSTPTRVSQPAVGEARHSSKAGRASHQPIEVSRSVSNPGRVPRQPMAAPRGASFLSCVSQRANRTYRPISTPSRASTQGNLDLRRVSTSARLLRQASMNSRPVSSLSPSSSQVNPDTRRLSTPIRVSQQADTDARRLSIPIRPSQQASKIPGPTLPRSGSSRQASVDLKRLSTPVRTAAPALSDPQHLNRVAARGQARSNVASLDRPWDVPELPKGWNSHHDRAICYLEVRGHDSEYIMARLRQFFPEFKAELTEQMVENRIRQLDEDINITYFAEALVEIDFPGSRALERPVPASHPGSMVGPFGGSGSLGRRESVGGTGVFGRQGSVRRHLRRLSGGI